MTCDERLEQLLNRAGQTISDLPKASKYSFAYPVNCENETKEHRTNSVKKAVQEFQFGYEFEKGDDRKYIDYILHLTDIIDRMETALENVIGERDYCQLKCCSLCMDCDECGIPEVPEDWSVDNG